MTKFTKVVVGNTYLLNCGVEVIVKELIRPSHCIVEDVKGNSRSCFRSQLISGSVSWKQFGTKAVRPPKKWTVHKLNVGQEFTSKDGVNLVVREYKDHLNVIVEGPEGNTRKVSSSRLRNGHVKWGRASPDFLKPKIGSTYVYQVHYDGGLVYIGKGKRTRYLHATRGTSNVFGLNELFFRGEKVVVSLHTDGLSNKDAEALEQRLIRELRPKFNKAHNTGEHNELPRQS